MNEILVKICPVCKGSVRIKNEPGIEQRKIRCSHCGEIAPSFMFMSANASSGDSKKTQYPDEIGQFGGNADDGKTQVNLGGGGAKSIGSNDPRKQMYGEFFSPTPIRQTPLAHIKASTCKQPLPLRLGENIIGRESNDSDVNIQFPEIGEHKHISRRHLKLEVKKMADNTYQYIVSLYKEGVNKTWVNDTLLMYGDKIIMQINDVIRLSGNVTLTLIEIDNDKTNLFD